MAPRFQYAILVALFHFLAPSSVFGLTVTRSNVDFNATMIAPINVNFKDEFDRDPMEYGFCKHDSPIIIRLCPQVTYVELECPTSKQCRVASYLGVVFESTEKRNYSKLDEGNSNDRTGNKKFKLTRDILNQSNCFYCWSESSNYARIERTPGFKFTFDFNCLSTPIDVVQEVASYGGPTVVSCWNGTIAERHTIEWSFRAPSDPYAFRPMLANNNDTSIAISNMTELDVGTYKCVIWFEDSFYRYEANIHLSSSTDGPPAPLQSRVLVLDASSITIAWVPATAITLPRFALSLYQWNGTEWLCLNDRQSDVRVAYANVHVKVFRHLDPHIAYKIEIRLNSTTSGMSKPLIIYFWTRTSRHQRVDYYYDDMLARPENELSSLRCPIYDQVTKVNWYKRDESSGDWKPLDSTSFPVTTATVGRYKCEMPGEPLLSLVFKLVILKRPIKPQQLQCFQNGGKIEFKWSKRSEADEKATVSYGIEKYKLMHRKIGSQDGWSMVQLAADQYSSVMERQDGSLVSFRLVASNRAGDSEASTISCSV